MGTAVRIPTFQTKTVRAKEVMRFAKWQVRVEEQLMGQLSKENRGQKSKEDAPRSGPRKQGDPGVGLQAQGTGAVLTDRAQSMVRGWKGLLLAFRDSPGVLGLRLSAFGRTR